MIKRIIQVCSMLALTVVFFAVSANAQVTSRIEAKIPFDFNVSGKSYKAGDYILRLSKGSISSVNVSLEDEKGNSLQNFVVATNGEVANGEERLVFDTVGGERYLSKILTNDKGLSLLVSEVKKESAGKVSVASR